MRRRNQLLRLRDVLLETFTDKGATRITICILKRRGYSHSEGGQIYWETAIAVCVWVNGNPTCAMGIEFKGNALCIRQLQGVGGVRVPRALYAWPQLFIKSCIAFALHEGLAAVRVYRANQSLFYYYPTFVCGPDESATEMVEEIQSRMRNRYDGTAEALGLTMYKKYGEWKNPHYARS